MAKEKVIILAGANGELGKRIGKYIVEKGATLKALVRKESVNEENVSLLRGKGASIIETDFNNDALLTKACTGADCIVSALSGVRDVIIDVQQKLLNAAVAAGVPRFIPSDYCIDYTKLPYGSNRNLDLRREFSERLDKAPIKATSILNGMFTDLLTGQAPVILFGQKRILYWGNANQLMDFTTMDNTAEFTANAVLDDTTSRFLCISGDVTSMRGIQEVASDVTGEKFKLFRAGGLGTLKGMIKVTRFLFPKKNEIFPPWQGMQYLHNMLSGLPKLTSLDNGKYKGIEWDGVKEVLERRKE